MTTAILNPQALPADSRAMQAESLAVLYAEHGQRIFRFLLASLRDRDLAETLTQETFLRAWTAMNTGANFRGDASVMTWLTRIALNLLRDQTRTDRFRFWRRAARTSVSAADLGAFLPDHASSAESAVIARQQLALIWETVPQLTERQRTVFLLRFVEELELTEIAAITGLPLPTVKTHLYRALATIRSRHASAVMAKERS